MEMVDVLKSIVCGITEQTKMGTIKWIDESKVATIEKQLYSYVSDKKGLDPALYYRLDRNTVIEVHFYLYRDGNLNRSFMWIKNENLQEGHLSVDAGFIPEYANLEKVLFDSYITPKINKYPKNFNSDMAVLAGMDSKCGIDVARDLKLNSILDDDKKGWFSKLF